MGHVTTISSSRVSLKQLFELLTEELQLELSEETKKKIQKSRQYLESRIQNSNDKIYGVNTGFGSLCNVEIDADQTEQLQYNLITSHAAGVGEEVPIDICRLMLLLKIKNLSFGYSGVRLELIEKMVSLYNNSLIPVIFQQGSLGASGDLAPLSHLSLPLLGLGEVWYEGKRHQSTDVLKKHGIEPMKLSSKEGLALINGTQFSLAYGIWASYHASRLLRWANVISSVSLEAYLCCLDPFDEDLHIIRQHEGQQAVAREIRQILDGSEIVTDHKHSVQDPYSFRCIPQVHGASSDAISYVSKVIENELNAVTDNPNVFADEDKILSGGNFHAQPLALALDFLSIALSELASISERRLYKLVSGERDLPDYLTKGSGLHSGLMIVQYTAASVVSQNKQLCTPASVDSITSSKGQEDHVSMAANAATKTYRVVENVYKVLAMELIAACQALEFRSEKKSSPKISELKSVFRQKVKRMEEDRVLYGDIQSAINFIKSNAY